MRASRLEGNYTELEQGGKTRTSKKDKKADRRQTRKAAAEIFDVVVNCESATFRRDKVDWLPFYSILVIAHRRL